MATKVDKVIATNLAALKGKYGGGLTAIRAAIRALVEADKKRGLTTKLVDIASATSMKKLAGKAVTNPTDPKQNKTAVDAVYAALRPAYVLLLGAIDVIPHQDLKNPAHAPGEDDDKFAYGDLPYACDHSYSQSIKDFLGPTRVVGRLPDVTGGTDAGYLVGLLTTAAKYQSRTKQAYMSYFGLSAKVWKGSTGLSLQKLFGDSTQLQLSPPKGPPWAAGVLGARSHFINCHGAAADPQYYGQQGSSYPVAHHAAKLGGLVEGTVAAAECCYGAELYNPYSTGLGGQAGICNSYLAAQTYGFLGSSTIAYGPADTNGAADLLCQYFIKHVLNGASTGRATLQARQDYILKMSVADPIDLKTIAQFSLMGDPAVHPVEPSPVDHAVAAPKTRGKIAIGPLAAAVASRLLRRDTLHRVGTALAGAAQAIRLETKTEPAAAIKSILKKVAADAGAAAQAYASFQVQRPAFAAKTRKGGAAAPAAAGPSAVHMAIGHLRDQPTDGKFKPLVAVVAREQDGQLLLRTFFSR
jgi:hypothetical protein